ncbi:MAG: M20/M25/M40 family metallo-hydrolase [Chloroflexi bacterium]|nr:M20/M25/M40 family metallo-hydrolase [Chloroflexota bacterium]
MLEMGHLLASRPFRLALLAAALASAACAEILTPPPDAAPADSVPAAAPPAPTTLPAPQISGERPFQHVLALAEGIGVRASGSPAERRAADYLAGQLRSWGYHVSLQEFDFTYTEDASSLVIQGENPIDVFRMAGSPEGDVSAALVDAGEGRAEELTGEVRGGVALIRRGAPLTFREKVANAAAAGALGAIIYNNQPGAFGGSLGEAGAIPAVSLPLEDGERLLGRLAGGPVQVTLSVSSHSEQLRSQNVVADLNPAGPRTVIIGGHYDSVAEGPGANDNASGTAAALEVARLAAEQGLAYNLRFVGFGAEELGLFGSRHYVESLPPEERRRVTAMINLDMVAVGDQLRLAGEPSLLQRGRELADREGVGVVPSSREGAGAGGSDHAPFARAGIPWLFFNRQPDPNYHTAGDRAEHVRPEFIEQTVRLTLAILRSIE